MKDLKKHRVEEWRKTVKPRRMRNNRKRQDRKYADFGDVYDIGIASAWKSQRSQHTPQEWKELLSQSDSKQKY